MCIQLARQSASSRDMPHTWRGSEKDVGCSECMHHRGNCTTNFGPVTRCNPANCFQVYCSINNKFNRAIFKGAILWKTHFFYCLCVYILVSYVPTNTQTETEIRQPSQFGVGWLTLYFWDWTSHLDLMPLLTSFGDSLKLYCPPTSIPLSESLPTKFPKVCHVCSHVLKLS